ncbi:hypothetical protein C8J57DRAFT_1244095 [Mycena rebaudengoi]|nr:hypothetical protein C8J57DRAFT_1244095 [Mycena rebaudengoi]
MTDLTPPASNTSSPDYELDVLVSRVATLVQLTLDMARIVVDVQHRLPIVVQHRVDAAVEAAVDAALQAQVADQDFGSSFIPGIPITPDALALLHPPGVGDDTPWHVVLVGREPGMYQSVGTATDLVLGVPNASRKKKADRVEALTYYRNNYNAQKVQKLTEAPLAPPPHSGDVLLNNLSSRRIIYVVVPDQINILTQKFERGQSTKHMEIFSVTNYSRVYGVFWRRLSAIGL